MPYLSYLAIIMLFGAMLVLYVIPLRYLLMAWGKFGFKPKNVLNVIFVVFFLKTIFLKYLLKKISKF